MLNVPTWPEAYCALHIIMKKKITSRNLKKSQHKYLGKKYGKFENKSTHFEKYARIRSQWFNRGYDQ